MRTMRLPLGLILTIESVYRNLSTRVCIQGRLSRPLTQINSVAQGSSMGPLTSILYYSIIIRYQRSLNVGLRVNNELVCCRAFADDLLNISVRLRDA